MSQSIPVQCPHCHSQGNLADTTLLGQPICCPICQQVFVAPAPAAALPLLASVPALTGAPVLPVAEVTPAVVIAEGSISSPAETPDTAPVPTAALPVDHPAGPPPEPVVTAAILVAHPAGEAKFPEAAAQHPPVSAESAGGTSSLAAPIDSVAGSQPRAESEVVPPAGDPSQVLIVEVSPALQPSAAETTPDALAIAPADVSAKLPGGTSLPTEPVDTVAASAPCTGEFPSTTAPAPALNGEGSPPVQRLVAETIPVAVAIMTTDASANLPAATLPAGIPVVMSAPVPVAANADVSSAAPPVAAPVVWQFGAAPPGALPIEPDPLPIAAAIVPVASSIPVAAVVMGLPAAPTSVSLPAGAVVAQEAFPGLHSHPAPIHATFDGPLPSFMAPPPPPGAAEVMFAQSLPEPEARGSVAPPKPQSRLKQTIVVSSITVIVLFATVMFLLGDPWRRFGKVKPPPEPKEMNPIAKPFVPDANESMDDVFARIKAQSQPASKDQ